MITLIIIIMSGIVFLFDAVWIIPSSFLAENFNLISLYLQLASFLLPFLFFIITSFLQIIFLTKFQQTKNIILSSS